MGLRKRTSHTTLAQQSCSDHAANSLYGKMVRKNDDVWRSPQMMMVLGAFKNGMVVCVCLWPGSTRKSSVSGESETGRMTHTHAIRIS